MSDAARDPMRVRLAVAENVGALIDEQENRMFRIAAIVAQLVNAFMEFFRLRNDLAVIRPVSIRRVCQHGVIDDDLIFRGVENLRMLAGESFFPSS